MKLGYVRVSSAEQCLDRQLAGVKVDRMFEDRMSGKDRNRPQLDKLLDNCRAGDVVIVHSMDRLARDLFDLQYLVRQFNAAGVTVQFTKESLTFDGSNDSIATLQLQIMGAVAQFERSMIRERQREGIAIKKAKGGYLGKGRHQKLTPSQVDVLRTRAAMGGATLADLALEYKVSRGTLYNYLRAARNAELESRLATRLDS